MGAEVPVLLAAVRQYLDLDVDLNRSHVRGAIEVWPDLLQAGVEQPRVSAPVRADLRGTRARHAAEDRGGKS